MRPHRPAQLGFLLLVCSFVAALVRFALPYLWAGVLVRGAVQPVLGQPLATFWVPLLGDLVGGAIAVLGLAGFLLLRQGRFSLGAAYAEEFGLAILALIVASVVLAAWFATGFLAGLVTGLNYLAPWRRLLLFLGTVFLGLALYGALANLPFAGMRAVAAVTLVLGIAGGAITLVASFGIRRTEALTLRGAAETLSLVSLVVWLAICAWSWDALRSGRAGPPVAAPVRNP